jgi:hypothetical protein
MVKAKKQAEYHWDKGDISWSPAPPKKQEGKKVKKTESLIERLQRQKREKEAIINSM